MRFRDWLTEDLGAATTAMHGGITEIPGAALNTNMPVRSKISTKDGSDAATAERGRGDIATRLFGRPGPARERPSQWIDRSRRRARFVTVPPDIIY